MCATTYCNLQSWGWYTIVFAQEQRGSSFVGSLQAAATRDTTEQLDKSLGEFLTNHSYVMV